MACCVSSERYGTNGIKMMKPKTSIRMLGAALAASVFGWAATPASAALSPAELQQLGTKIAADLAKACPHKPGEAAASYEACAAALKKMSTLPMAAGVLWGNDQANLRIKQRKLTHFRADLFRAVYLPMFAFTGKFTIARDEADKMDILKMEAYFRNSLPSGDYPYPFWHNPATWGQFEAANVINLYIDGNGRVVIFTRSGDGSNDNRGSYAHVEPPVFVQDQWTWTDAKGQTQPRVMLFSSRYQAANPRLVGLDKTYRAFAETMREASCIACHNPKNPGGMNRLALLQTPLHAAAEIDRVIKSVRDNRMPEDDIGLPKDIDPKLRESILRTAEAFRAELVAADAWETARTTAPRATNAPAAAPATAR